MQIRQKLNTILLIDDNQPTNVYNKKLIDKSGIAIQVDIANDGRQGLEYLSHKEKYPDLILVDIDMPHMNGWEFIAEFNTLPISQQKESTVIMLSTSPNPRDQLQALLMDAVIDYKKKPLNIETLNEIIQDHFDDHL